MKVENEHQHSFIAYNFEDIQPLIVSVLPFLITALISKETSVNEITHSPPLISHQDTYLRNNVFRI